MDNVVREEIAKWISQTKNNELLETLKLIKESSTREDWYENLKKHEKQSIKRGQKDHEEGNTLTSKEFWEKHA